jgi:secreted trypsin-like serine protease
LSDPGSIQAIGNSEYDRAVERYQQKTVKKIVGGMLVATPGAYPWQTSLGVARIPNPAQAHYCGGSIYDAQWILTAAHCVKGVRPTDLTIVVGTNQLLADTPRRQVATVLYHSSFDSSSLKNDIALVKLAEPLQFSALVRPINLASTSNEDAYLTPNTEDLIITGWGAEVERGPHAVDLRYAMETFIPTATCQLPLSYGKLVTESMLCAGIRGRGTCDGDSGGPLFIDRGNPILFGLTSFAKGCAETLKFDVFTRVTKYLDWVRTCVTNPASQSCHRN